MTQLDLSQVGTYLYLVDLTFSSYSNVLFFSQNPTQKLFNSSRIEVELCYSGECVSNLPECDQPVQLSCRRQGCACVSRSDGQVSVYVNKTTIHRLILYLPITYIY